MKTIDLGSSDATCPIGRCERPARRYTAAQGFEGYVDACVVHAEEAVEHAVADMLARIPVRPPVKTKNIKFGIKLTHSGNVYWWRGPKYVRLWHPDPAKAKAFATPQAAEETWERFSTSLDRRGGKAGIREVAELP